MKEATPFGVSSFERLYSNQEEADTRMILHASSLSRDHERIRIQCGDTCNGHMPNEEVVEPVGHGRSACDDGGITQTMFTQAPAPVEVRDLTHLYCTDKDCLSARMCPCLLAGLECIGACSCTGCGNQNNKPEGDDGTEMDTDV